jgi:ribosomal protein S18 acetylase RimI-like enzyme
VLRVSAAEKVTDDLYEAVSRLLPQLSSSAGPLSRHELDEIVGSSATTLLVACDDGNDAGAPDTGPPDPGVTAPGPARNGSGQGVEADGPIVGMLTLVTFRLPTGVRAWVEDVVVDTSLRGRGIGEALTQAAVELAGAKGALTVDLTSRPSRESANRLYMRVGFELRNTNVYRYRLPS